MDSLVISEIVRGSMPQQIQVIVWSLYENLRSYTDIHVFTIENDDGAACNNKIKITHFTPDLKCKYTLSFLYNNFIDTIDVIVFHCGAKKFMLSAKEFHDLVFKNG